MNRIILALILCVGLVGCIPTAMPLVATTRTDWQTQGPVNHSGTQMAGIQNHGTMQVYINSQPDPDPVADPGLEVIKAPGGDGIKKHEGLSLKPYTDPGNKLHIGYGRNLTDKGITGSEAEMLFKNDLAESRADLSENIFPEEWQGLPDVIKGILVNMRYQLGSGGFREFDNMIAAVRTHSWQTMAAEMKNSRWAEQTPGRAGVLIKIVESVGRKDG